MKNKEQIVRQLREVMRMNALLHRRFTAPSAFDGTEETYSRNLSLAVEFLRLAIYYRKVSSAI